MTKCDHRWTLYTPMDDGTGRDSRYCRDCGLIQTVRNAPWQDA